jgi:hypothetical protein
MKPYYIFLREKAVAPLKTTFCHQMDAHIALASGRPHLTVHMTPMRPSLEKSAARFKKHVNKNRPANSLWWVNDKSRQSVGAEPNVNSN